MADRTVRFEEIYDAYSGLILAYAARRTGGIDEAADIVAETFTVAWRRMDDVPAGDEARPWLYGVARRVLANHHRGAQRRCRLDERLMTESLARPPSESDAGQLELIAQAFGALGDADRELLTLVGWDGLERDAIAVVLGCTVATVRVRLHRARRRFENELAAVGMQRSGAHGHGYQRRANARPDPEEA